MIFPNLDFEPIVQVSDRTRLDASKSYVSKDESSITLVEIEPESGNGFINVTGSSYKDWYLDWQYTTDGDKTVSLRVTNGLGTETVTFTLSVITEANDNLFSNDADLRLHEPDILKWIEDGKNSYKYLHRRAQSLIIDRINQRGWRDVDGSLLTKANIGKTEEVKEWSTFLTLKIIFSGLSNAIDDVFAEKAKMYESKASDKSHPAILSLDLNNDGEISEAEEVNNFAMVDLVRR